MLGPRAEARPALVGRGRSGDSPSGIHEPERRPSGGRESGSVGDRHDAPVAACRPQRKGPISSRAQRTRRVKSRPCLVAAVAPTCAEAQRVVLSDARPRLPQSEPLTVGIHASTVGIPGAPGSPTSAAIAGLPQVLAGTCRTLVRALLLRGSVVRVRRCGARHDARSAPIP